MSQPALIQAMCAAFDFIGTDEDPQAPTCAGGDSPPERLEKMVEALRTARRLRQQAADSLDQEMARTSRLLAGLRRPRSPLAVPAYELARQGLEKHWLALEELADYLAGPEPGEIPEHCLVLAERSDQLLCQAELMVDRTQEDYPLVA